jgi:hypothetical protein
MKEPEEIIIQLRHELSLLEKGEQDDVYCHSLFELMREAFCAILKGDLRSPQWFLELFKLVDGFVADHLPKENYKVRAAYEISFARELLELIEDILESQAVEKKCSYSFPYVERKVLGILYDIYDGCMSFFKLRDRIYKSLTLESGNERMRKFLGALLRMRERGLLVKTIEKKYVLSQKGVDLCNKIKQLK